MLGFLKGMAGADKYKDGIIRLSMGQLGFMSEMLAVFIKMSVGKIRDDYAALDALINTELHKRVISSTYRLGLSLNGINPTKKGLMPAITYCSIW